MSKRLQANLRLIQLGVRGHLRNPGLRMLALFGMVTAAAVAWSQGSTAGSTSIALTGWLGRAFGVAACLWMGYSANRDQNDREGAVIRSKPLDGAAWVTTLWLTGTLVWLAILGAAFAAAAAAQLPQAGAVSLTAHLIGFGRAGIVLAIAATLAFSLSRLMRSPLGGVIIMFAWFCAMGGLKLIPAFLQPEYSQNTLLYVAAGAAMVCLTGALVERCRRGEMRRVPLVPLAGLAVFLAAAAGGAALAYQKQPNPNAAEFTIWSRISRQHVLPGLRTPGFWLPDGKGGTVRTAAYRGKILVLYFFSARDTESARMLTALDLITREYGPRGVQPIGICLSPDHGDGWTLARSGYHFPIGIDLSTVTATDPPEAATAIAYDAQTLPLLVVTDRSRRVTSIVRTPDSTADSLRPMLEERLQAEPE